ncbi:hypothetical protein F5144DRAFT_599020 [Chaetomium tenue]|uniref:Uncharacterized protein n=1 Tax=Chaetomium tenue TaxID=1854479 RepID=A0ACB7PFG1_9PEZI|nr:hypothetical protein F5144DRAFT_599020 [Chaetomium globosum]
MPASPLIFANLSEFDHASSVDSEDDLSFSQAATPDGNDGTDDTRKQGLDKPATRIKMVVDHHLTDRAARSRWNATTHVLTAGNRADWFGGSANITQPERPPAAASSSTKTFPASIKPLCSPAGAIVDIVFVHGRTGDREKTWTASDASEPWPKNIPI